jgi:hypothetical protein
LLSSHRDSSATTATFRHANTAEAVPAAEKKVKVLGVDVTSVNSAPPRVQRQPSTKTHRRRVLKSFLWGGGKEKPEAAEKTAPPSNLTPTPDPDPVQTEDVSDMESVSTLATTQTFDVDTTSIHTNPQGKEEPEAKAEVQQQETGEATELDLRIVAESDEITKLTKERAKLVQRIEEMKKDIEECRVGWKRSWARCEREIGEKVLAARAATGGS